MKSRKKEFKKFLKKTWSFLKEDSWQSWLVSIIIIVIFIKLIFFPMLSFITKSPLPLVIIESCSMYHDPNFNEWWNNNGPWYEKNDISKENFRSFPFKNGLNKGDIIFVTNLGNYKKGDVIIFNAGQGHPVIHRIVSLNPLETKGDNNLDYLPNGIEQNIPKNAVIGKASFRIPFLGWIKLIFFEPFRPPIERGFCKSWIDS